MTNPIRVPKEVHGEVLFASRMTGRSSSDLLKQAWEAYRQTPEFIEEFEQARKAFAVGDLNLIANRLNEQALQRAGRRSSAVREMRT